MRVRPGLVAIAILLAPGVARAADPAAAREQLKIGYDLAHDGKCEEALPHLVESLRLEPKAITLINLANCEEKTGKWADALGHWVDARARAQSEGVAPIEEEATKRQKALEQKIPRLTIVLGADAPKGTEVARDGVVLGAVSLGVALPVDPGSHTIVARAPGHAEGSKTVTLAEGESGRVEVAPVGSIPVAAARANSDASARGSGGTSPLVWIGFGTAVAGVAVGSITGVLALDRASSADRDCPNHACSDPSALDRIDEGRTFGTVSTIAFVVAGVGAAVGTYGLFAVRAGPGGVAVAGRF